MAIETQTFSWHPDSGFAPVSLPMANDAQLVILFASGDLADVWQEPVQQISSSYRQASVVGCSSAGEILGVRVSDGSIAGIAMRFDATETRSVLVGLNGRTTAEAVLELAAQISRDDLRYTLILSDGLAVNGSELASAFRNAIPGNGLMTGGLAGDGDRFHRTFVFHDGEAHADAIVAVAFYGDRLKVGHGSLGGWDPFGPTRTVTRSRDNVLYELDQQSALELYRRYLGVHASDLPASGLLFPLSITNEDGGHDLVRTLLAIDEANGSMTFAGSIPEGSKAKLMKANFDRLVDGAAGAASQSRLQLPNGAEMALLISCVGRKMVLGDRIEEEVEAVRETLGGGPTIIGFYSYGELSPVASGRCELHNQTMTITTLAED